MENCLRLTGKVCKIVEGKLKIPPEIPYVEAHNNWVVKNPEDNSNYPGSGPGSAVLAELCYYTQNGVCFYDDIHGKKIEGLEKFGKLIDIDNPLPLSFLEIWLFPK